jgi:putative sigma-54 modulation protein
LQFNDLTAGGISIGLLNEYYPKIVIGYRSPARLASGKKGDVVHINLSALKFGVTAAIGRHVNRRLTAATARTAGSATRAIVRLWDVNGTRGGIDKACRVVVWLRGRGTIVVEAVDRDLYAAIDTAATKLRGAISRHRKRRRTLRREHALRRVRRLPA